MCQEHLFFSPPSILVEMRLSIVTVAFVLIAVLSAPSALANSNMFTLNAGAWTCDAPGGLDKANASNASAQLLETAGCLPSFNPTPVTVLAFQGRFVFVCEKVNGGLIGPTYSCSYALTSDLRDAKGRVPAPKVAPGPIAATLFADPEPLNIPVQ